MKNEKQQHLASFHHACFVQPRLKFQAEIAEYIPLLHVFHFSFFTFHFSLPDLPIAQYNILQAGQALQTHRPSCVQLVRTYANFSA